MRATLAAELGNVFWTDLRGHVARGVVVIVAEELDILDVGEAVAKDDKTRISAWIEGNLLRKPELLELEAWSKITDARWQSIVVAPFVLVRMREAPEGSLKS
jgi:hypothetical protein